MSCIRVARQGTIEAFGLIDNVEGFLIEIKFQGRLGNKMYQYALGRIIAENLGLALDARLHEFPNASSVDGHRFEVPVQRLTGHRLDLNSILADRTPRRIVVDGFFHRHELYAEHIESLRAWFDHDEAQWLRPHKKELVLHVRGGDLYRTSGAPHPNFPPIPFRHYRRVIEETKPEQVAVVCESADDPVATKITDRFGGRLISQTPAQDFYFLKSAGQIVLSLSSLAWWAAWLSHADKIVFPMYGFWHPEGVRRDVSTMVPEARYLNVDLGIMDNWRSSDEQIADIMDG